MHLQRLEQNDRARDGCSVRRTENMAAIYCTRDTGSGGSLSLELEVLKADIAGR